jgi:hypothetical protein
MKNDTDINAEQKTGRRESTYPVFDLVEALKFATAIKELGGTRGTVAKSLLAKNFNLPESSPGFFQRLGAAKSFGIVDGHGSYTLSSEGKRYFYPTNEKEKSLASLNFLITPKAFAKIIELFDGEKLPKTELLGNILHKDAGVPISWKDRAVQIFIRSAQHLGLIDQNGILRYGAAKHSDLGDAGHQAEQDQHEVEQDNKNKTEQEIVRHPRVAGQLNVAPKVWTFTDDNKILLVETPKDLTMQQWEILNQYVQFLKPKDGQ